MHTERFLQSLSTTVVVVVVVVGGGGGSGVCVCVRACVSACARCFFPPFLFCSHPTPTPPPPLSSPLPLFSSFFIYPFRAGRGRGDNSKRNFVTSDQPTLSSPLLPRPPPPSPQPPNPPLTHSDPSVHPSVHPPPAQPPPPPAHIPRPQRTLPVSF